jgi:hypothetical protein
MAKATLTEQQIIQLARVNFSDVAAVAAAHSGRPEMRFDEQEPDVQELFLDQAARELHREWSE